MLKVLGQLVNIIEEILSEEIPGEREPDNNDQLAAIGGRLEAMSMDIKDRTSS